MEEVAESLQDIKEQKRVLLISKLKKGNVSNSAIKKRDNGKVAPLSYAQEPLWLMSQLEPENPIYNVAGGLEFSGVLNTETLHQSLNETIRRHEILQSRFVNEQGIVAQQVSDDSQLQLAHVDISQIDAKLRQAHFDQIAEEFISKPFNLINNPPLRGMLVTFGNQKHILVLTLHHIVADRWSVGILMQEVAALYKSYVIGLPSVLPELTIQYGDFAVWQKEQLEVSREKNSEYWQQKLEHAPPTLTLPLDYIRPSVPSYRGDLYQFEFSSSLSQAIKSLAKRNKATLFMTMAAIINILLSRYSGSRDIVLGYTSAGRNQAQTENLIGYFINTLVLRNQLDNDDSFISLLNRIQNQALLDQDHQDISFSQLKEAAGETGSKNEGRLFQVMLTVQNAPMSEFHLPGLTVKPIALENQVSQFDLTFLVEEQEGSLFGAIEYSTDLFETAILDRLVGHLKTLCEAIVVHPDKPIGQLEILTKPEWQQLVFDWNKPCKLERASEQDKPITSWIASKAETNPSAVALVFAEEKITYWELNTRANRLAHYLQIQGLGTETRIGIFAERSIEMVVAILAVLKSGAAYVPLDPSYPTERLIYMVKDVGAQLILTQLSLSNKLNFGNIPVALIDESYEDYPSEPPIQTATLDNTAYIIFTSGSSGQPKGVMVSHRNLLHSTLARLDYYQDVPECFLLISSFAFDSSVAGIFWTLSQGGCLCLPKNEETGNPAALAVLIKNHRVTHLLALPSFYKAIINDNATPSLTSLTTVIVAGEACSSEIANEHHGKLPDVKLYNEYGPTEATVWSSSYKVEKNEPVRTLPIGKVLNHGQIYLLDSHYQPVPIGVCGELYIGGLGISQGYVNRPDLTAERFIPDLFTGSGGRLYKTGDLARFRSDGNIEFIGRIDHQVKIRGYRVELEEIEVKLVACSGVRDAVVIVREDNEGDKRIVAYLIAEHDLVINDLRNQLPNALPEYMLPSAFVILDALPLTPNGKLDRKALPAPGLSDVAIQDFLPPQGAAEIILAKIWQELLAVERVGRNDHFFELGGHSLMAISLIEKLQQHEFAVDLMNVFNMPVLAELAASLSDLSEAKKFDVPSNLIPSNCTHITPDMLPLVTLSQTEIDSIASHVSGGMANIQDIYPLAPLQEGIFFHHLLNRENDTYIKRSVLGFDSRNRLDSFLNALQTVINRHDILRTAFHWEGISQSVQVVQRQASLPVIELDLIGIANTDDICAKLLKETDPRNIRLNLRQAPLFVAYIAFDHQLNQWLMSIINHHLIDDNYTLQLILSEIQKIIQGQGDKLPDSIPYRNFIVKALAVSPAEHESYFNAQLGDISEPTAPYRILDIQNNNRQVSEVKIQLNNALSQRIYDSATQHGVTPALLFHVAWGKVLGQCTGHDVVVFGTVLSGRLQGSEGVSQVLGMFINTLPLRVDLNSRSVKEVVNDTHHRLISLLDHEQASLALAQRCSAVDASLPLFTTLLNYRHTNLIVSQNNDSTDIFEWGGVQIFHSEERTNYPITVNVDDLSQGFSLTVQCVEEIDPERIAAYLNTAVAQLVDALSQTPEIPIGRLSILPAPERDQLLHGFNATNADYPQHRCIHDLFEAQAEANPAAIALIYEGESLSYGELNRHANRLAHHLISLGIRPDDRVAICVERSLEMVIGLLAILKAGGCYVPLDPGYPEGRLAYMLADSAPLAILTQSGLKARLPGLSASLEALGIPAVLLDGEGQGVRPAGEATNAQTDSIGDTNQKDSLSLLCVGHPEHNPDPAQLGLTSHHLAYVIYTSGSTGQPKGVMVEHKSIIRLVINSGYAPITSNDCVAHCASPVFDASIWEIWAPLLNGAKLLLIPQQILLNPTQLNKELIKGKVTALWLTVGLFNNYVEDLKEALNQLKYLLVGGDVLDPKIIKALLNGSNVPRKILNGYGPTETTTFASTHHIVTIEDETISIPIGRPIANTQIYILDRHLQPVPLGVTGEIHIGGAGVARGYLNRPELTAERFIADPFGQGRDNLAGAACGGRLYKTGDLGRWLPDGSVDYLGRNDFQVKIRGFRIELGEVEAQLSRCPGIREAVVMAREDVPGDKRLVAYLVAEAGQEPTAADLRGQLSAVLAEYMVPGAYVALEAFPLTPNGKLDRKALPAPDGSSVTCRAYEPPQGAAEAAIAHIWQELLHLGQVGRHDHFFELGGHSLLAVQLVSRLRQELGIEVPLRDLFARPVLAGFARAVTNARQSELPPIQMADRSQPIPLSWAQQRLWFLGQLDPAASAAYHIPAGLRLHGRLDKAALKASLDRIVARHEILRTSFISQDGQAFQHIAPAHGGFALAAHDLSGLSKRKQRTAVQQTAADEASQAFDLSTGPLIRGQLLELGADEHILLITQHHIISDGWSIGLLVQEFAALYAAFSQGQPDPLPDLAVQYADYAAWQRQWLQGDTLQAQTAFWQSHLTGAPAMLELPTDRPRPTTQSYAGGSVGLELSKQLSADLKHLAQRHGSTLFMVLLAGWSILMARLSGLGDIVIGTPIANRQRSEVEPLIGFFVNTLALRVRLDDNPSVAALLNRVKATTLDAYGHQDIPFEQVVDLVKPERSLGHSPVFQVMLAMDNTPGTGELALPGLNLSGLELAHTTTHFELSLFLTDREEHIAGILEYASELFDKVTIERFKEYYQLILVGMVTNAQQRIGQLPFLPEAERHQLLHGFNATAAGYPHQRCVHELFEGQALANPAATALVYEGESLSYGELNRHANRLAHRLIGLGIRPDDRVAICAERGLEMVVGLLGILKAGGCYVPLDPGYPEERLAYMLTDSSPSAILTQSGLKARLPGLGASPVPVVLLGGEGREAQATGEATGAAGLDGLCAGHPEHNPVPARLGLSSRHLAYVIYTSGSTGQPKCVGMEHSALVNLLQWQSANIKSNKGQITLQFAALGFDVAFQEIFSSLCYGECLLLINETVRHDFYLLTEILAEYKVQKIFLPTIALQGLAEVIININLNLPCLVDVITAGEQLRITKNISEFIRQVPFRRLHNHYGPTETHVVTSHTLNHDLSTIFLLPPIGRPIANTQIYILDGHLQPVPLGVTGEIYIGGAGVARGYLGRPGLTAERFIADPFRQSQDNLAGSAGGGRLYKTGDLGRWLPDGSIDYLGRNDFQVKIRGFRIELGEIEAQLSQCPGIKEAVVMAREDVPGDKRLVAYLVAEAGQEPTAADLRGQLSAVLAEYMVPSAYVTLEAFPLTPNGKLDRKALPAPDGSSVTSRAYEAPQGRTEALVAQIWQQLLNLDQVGRHDHFFELGGHSLLAVQLVSRLRQELGIEVPLRDLFAQPVLADFARTVTDARQAELPPIQVADRSQPIPLSWAQQRLWFLDQLDPAASVAYHIPAGLRLQGQLNKAALKASLDRIVARHENLRTRFVSVDGQAFQRIAPAHSGFALAEHDLSGLSKRKQRAAAEKIAADEASQAFDLSIGPLIRGQLLRLGKDEHILLITQHHIISDGWSIGLLVREFGALYAAFSQGREDPLPELSIQYADYAAWQRQWLQGDVLEAQMAFWQSHLTGAPALLELPTDRPRPAVQGYAGGVVSFALSSELNSGLKHLAQRHGSTLFMVLLAGWSILMARLSGQGDLVIGTPIANRQRTEVEPLIGFFVNTLALRVRLDGNPSVASLLKQVKATTLDAYGHQDIPFEQVVELIKPERSMGHSPVFQVMLAMDNTPNEGELTLPGLCLSGLELAHTTTQFDLSLSLTDSGENIVGSLEYASELFDESTIERFTGYYQALLTGMAADGQQCIGQLSILPEAERRQLLHGFNATAADYPQRRCIHELFEAQAQANPAATALVYEGESLSYGELNRHANRLAHRLIGLGIRPDDRVAICAERSLEMVIGLLAILKSGGCYVPLDPGYPEERLAYMLSDSAPVAVLTQSGLKARLPSLSATLDASPVPVILLGGELAQEAHSMGVLTEAANLAGLCAGHPEHNPDPAQLGLTSDHLAYVIYTSGSTGQPKGVMVSHANIGRLFAATQAQYHFTADDTWTLFHSFAFDFSVWELWGPLSYGGRLLIVPHHTSRNPEAFYQLLAKERVTVLNQTPSAFRQLIAAQADNPMPHNLRCVIFGGEALEFHSLKPWIERNSLNGTRLVNMYGITETTVHATYRSLTEEDIQAGQASNVGKPLDDLQFYILDGHLQPVPLGVTGEIYIGGAGVARGYLGRPGLTAERFIADPFRQSQDNLAGSAGGGRLYKTGDLGRWLPDGSIDYLGRNDFQVKIRGFRIELGEIEAQLSQCPGIKEAVVMAREDVPGDKRLVAYLVAEAGQEPTAADLRGQLSAVLAEYMVPSAYVTLEAFPLTPNGKLDRKALPAPDGSSVTSRAYEAPQGRTEALVAQIWQQLLNLDQVGRHDHFFELGGHSLMVVTFIERLRQQGLSATVRTVFTSAVLADMAVAITEQSKLAKDIDIPPNLIPDSCTVLTPDLLPLINLSQEEIDKVIEQVPGGVGNIQDIYPLAPLQEGILFHHLLEQEGDAYLLRSVLSFDTKERLDNFLNALQTVIDRHDILRTAIHWAGLLQPVQVVQRQAPLAVTELNMTGSQDIQTQLLDQTDPRRMRIDISCAPLFAIYIACDSHRDEWLMALLNHHIICDHLSLELIIAEIQQILEGQSASLPKPLPYRNFIAQALAISPAEHEAYFKVQLGDITESTAPFGILDIQGDGSRINEVILPLSDDLAQRIRASARQHGITAAVLFHAAWGLVLGQCTGRDEVVFGTVLLGRLQGSEGADRVLGMFINTLPVRVDLGGHSAQAVIQATYRRLSGLLNHEQASLSLAQRCSAVDASLPLFTTLLNFRHSGQPSNDDGLMDTQLAETSRQAWEGVSSHQSEERTNYPITVDVDDLGQGFSLTAQCVEGIDPERITAYLNTAIAQLVDALSHTPEIPIGQLSILPEAERRQLLHGFNATAADYPQRRCIHELFEAQAQANPAATALVYEGESLSYGELNRHANRLAHRLIGLGIRPDDRVAICAERSLEMVIGLLAILKSGGCYVPLDPGYPEERLAYMLSDSAPVAVLTQSGLKARLPSLSATLDASPVPVILLGGELAQEAHSMGVLTEAANLAGLCAGHPEHNPDPAQLGLTSDHLAYVIYTSGSTGQPKGVMVEHAQLVNYAIEAVKLFGLFESDTVLQQNSLNFDLFAPEIVATVQNQGYQYQRGHSMPTNSRVVHLIQAFVQQR